MPLNRYQIRNEYSLADPELYKVADKDDPEALLEGVAMAGLVGVLRQLGDLAEFAAEIFHDLHEEVMATAARGHGLIVRVQQLEAEFPLIERTLLSQTSHTSFLYNTGVDWHPNLREDQSVVTRGDLPRFVMDSYEECRGPPRLFLLDKFDVAGAGACLKRFTDPSFFKMESTSSTGRRLEGQREKKSRRAKKRGPRWRNGDTPESFPSSHAKLHQLFLEERIESGINDPARRVKLKKRQFTGSLFDQDNVKSYMEKFLDTGPQEQKVFHEICIDPLALTWTSDNVCESGLEIVEIGTVSPVKESIQTDRSFCSSPEARDIVVKQSLGDFNQDSLNSTSYNESMEVPELNNESHDTNMATVPKVVSGQEISGRESMSEVSADDACDFDDVASEIDNYVDALANIDSEVETDSDSKKNSCYMNLKPIIPDSDVSERQWELHRVSLDSQSVGNSITSEDGDRIFKDRESSSCSTSVKTLTETTPDLDATVVAVSSIQASNSDSDNMLYDHHSKSEEILRNEREKHASASIVHAEVVDILKSELVDETSNTTSHAGLNMKLLPEVTEASLKENPLPDRESEDSAKIDIVFGETDKRLTNHSGILPFRRTFSDGSEDSGHLIHVEPSVLDKEDSHHSVGSLVERHDKEFGMANIDTCSDSGPPDSSASFVIQELLPGTANSGHTSLDVAAGNLPCSWEDPSTEDSIAVGEERVSFPVHAISNQLHTGAPEFSSPEITEAAELTESGSLEADMAVASSRDDSNSEISGSTDKILVGKPSIIADPLELQHECLKIPSEATDTSLLELRLDEASKRYSGNGTGCSVSVSGNEGEAAPHVSLFEEEPICQDFTCIYPDQTQAFDLDTLVNDRISQTVTLHGENTIDHTPTDQHEGMDNIFSHDASPLNIPCKHANGSDYVLVAENDLNLDHHVEKVEHIESVADGPQQVEVKDVYHQNGNILLSLSVQPEKFQEPPLLDAEEFCQNDEDLTKGHREALTDRSQTDPVRAASIISTANMLNMSSDDSSSKLFDDSLPEDVKNGGKLAAEAKDMDPLSHDLLKSQYVEREESAGAAALHYADQLKVSKISPQSAECTLETSNVVFHRNGMLSGANQATQLENSGQPLSQQDFPDLGMRPAEPRLNLEPPSLPPLPPMQWRLGRFQNSAAVPAGRQIMQHTRVPVQIQPMSLPTMHHTLAPVQSMTLPAVHHNIASPVALAAGNSTLVPIPQATLPTALPAVQYTFAPHQPVTLLSSDYGNETIARTLTSEGQLVYSDGYVAQQGVLTLPMPVGVSEGFFQINTSAVGRQDNLPSTIPSTSTVLDGFATQHGVRTPSMPSMVSEGSSQTNTFEAGRKDDVPYMVSSASTISLNSTQISEETYQSNVDRQSESLAEGHFSEHSSTVEARVNTETAYQNELLGHGPKVSEEKAVNSYVQPLVTSVVDQAFPGLVAPDMGRAWSSAYDVFPIQADGNINETLQKKPPRPRNPLIDEVVAIDKSKLRKVERTKPSLEFKSEEGESLREQMQLRKVERVKPSVESKAEGGEYLLEHLQLRKVGERLKPPVEQKVEEEYLREQLQLRKVGERVKSLVEPKSEEKEFLLEQLQLRKVEEKTRQEVELKIDETESPLVQLRKVKERVREEVELKAEETESPRMQLRKVGERARPQVGQKAEERDSLFEQIRNKSFNLKPAVAARPNIQGPRTNLKVAAILEKASTIRQAMAGSDEDDDEDNWSDS